MKHLTNLYNPNLPDAKQCLILAADETAEEAWEAQERWLRGKIIGPPQSTEKYSISDLEAMGLVGVYEP